MTDETAMIRACADAPNDDAPRFVYADWRNERATACPGGCVDGMIPIEMSGVKIDAKDLEKPVEYILEKIASSRICPTCAGAGQTNDARELLAQLAEPDRCFPVACEPEWGRTIGFDLIDSIIHVGIRRGLVEYVRCPLDTFVRVAGVLKDWPLLVVDLPGIIPGYYVNRPGEYWFDGTPHDAHRSWLTTRPEEIPLDLVCAMQGGERAVRETRRTLRGDDANNWRWDLSRAAVRVLRKAGGLRPLADEDFQKAECLWVGRPLEEGRNYGMGSGWLAYDSDFKPVTDWSFRGFGLSFHCGDASDPDDPAQCPVLDRSAAWAALPEILRKADRRDKATLQRAGYHRRRIGMAVPIARENLFNDRTGRLL